MSNINELQKYRLMHEIHLNKLSGLLQDEWMEYCQFLAESNISTLPDNQYRDGKPLDYGEVRRLYDLWRKKKIKSR